MIESIVKNERTKNKKEPAITAGVEPNQTLNPWNLTMKPL
jgi:hypothetical protein